MAKKQERYRIERIAPAPNQLVGTLMPNDGEWMMVRNHDDEPMCMYSTKAEAESALIDANR